MTLTDIIQKKMQHLGKKAASPGILLCVNEQRNPIPKIKPNPADSPWVRTSSAFNLNLKISGWWARHSSTEPLASEAEAPPSHHHWITSFRTKLRLRRARLNESGLALAQSRTSPRKSIFWVLCNFPLDRRQSLFSLAFWERLGTQQERIQLTRKQNEKPPSF